MGRLWRYEGMEMKTKMEIKWNSGKTKMKIKMKIDMKIKIEMKTDGWNIV